MGGRIKRPEEVRAYQLPRVGLVKTGKKSDKGYPMSLDYFIATGKYKGLFDQAYPGKPQTIQIVFWEDDPSTMCEERYEYRDLAGKLYARGDGENFEVWTGSVYSKFTETEHPGIMERVHKKVGNKNGWDVILTLRFILPKINSIAGHWQYTTKGKASTIPAVRDMFDAMLESRGSVRGVIFDLNVQFVKSQKPGSNSRYPVVSLVPNQSKENIEGIGKSMLNVKSDNLLNESND